MPIVTKTSARVLPANARTADVARETLNRLIPIQNRKTDAAFQVNGYNGVLYSYLTNGQPCACQAKQKTIKARLDTEGNATPEDINAMLTSSGEFGVTRYGTPRANTPAYAEQKAQVVSTRPKNSPTVLEVNVDAILGKPVPLQSLFNDDDIQGANRHTEGLPDRVDFSGENFDASLVVDEDTSASVEASFGSFDHSLLGHSDVACPICFGSGFVGGFSIMQGLRKVFTFGDPSLVLPADATIEVEKPIPTITTNSVSWQTTLPLGCVGIDAFRVWNETNQVFGFTVLFDGIPVVAESDIFRFCDGREHTLEFRFFKQTVFTHVELQLNQSNFSANFELPKLTKGSNQSIREATDPFTVQLSPRVPLIKPLDVIVESTFGKALQVKTVSGMTDRHATTMGWTVEVRPTQPQELFFMLPRRKALQQFNDRSMVVSNPQTT